MDNTTYTCDLCNLTCLTCDGPSDYNCTSCDPSLILDVTG